MVRSCRTSWCGSPGPFGSAESGPDAVEWNGYRVVDDSATAPGRTGSARSLRLKQACRRCWVAPVEAGARSGAAGVVGCRRISSRREAVADRWSSSGRERSWCRPWRLLAANASAGCASRCRPLPLSPKSADGLSLGWRRSATVSVVLRGCHDLERIDSDAVSDDPFGRDCDLVLLAGYPGESAPATRLARTKVYGQLDRPRIIGCGGI